MKKNKEIELCMKFPNCKFCPKSGKCEKEIGVCKNSMAEWCNGSTIVGIARNDSSTLSSATK